MVVTIGVDHAELFDKLHQVLDQEANPIRRQIAIELMMTSHVCGFNNLQNARRVLDGMRKHVDQMTTQFFKEK